MPWRQPSTVSRKLRRNPHYSAIHADQSYVERKNKCGVRTKFTLEKGVLILKKLHKTWSPEQIVGSLFQEEGLSFKTATTNHRKEFSSHERIREALGLPMYFANSYYSWKRGSNENANGLLPEFFLKGTYFGKVSRSELAQALA